MAKKTPKRARSPKKKIKFGGPYLIMAAFCDRILTEKSNVWSIIRVADRITVKSPLPEFPAGHVQQTLALIFKAGDSTSKHTLTLTLRNPALNKLVDVKAEIDFTRTAKEYGPAAGAEVEVPMAIAVKETGTYWIDVALDGKRMTRVPLTIRYEQLRAD